MSMDERTHQAKIAEVVKLKKAAILQVEQGLAPAAALKAADLPADVKGKSNWANKLGRMRGHLRTHLDEWAADSWGGRSSPSPPVSAASSPSTSRASSPTPGSSAAAAAAATPKLFLPLPAQNLAYVKELEQKVKDLEREKDRVARAARKKVNRRDKEVDKQKGLLSKEREQHAHTRDDAAHFNNEAEEAKEALEEWIAQNQDDPQVKNCSPLTIRSTQDSTWN